MENKSETHESKGTFQSQKKIKNYFTPSVMELIADIISIPISSIIQYWIRFESGLFPKSHYNISDFIPVLLFFLTYWLLIFWLSGLYKNWYIRSPFEELFAIIRVTFIGNFIIFFFTYIDKFESPRMLFLLNFVIIAFVTSFGRTIARRVQRKLRATRKIFIPAIIVGSKDKIIDLNDKIQKAPAWGYKTIGVVYIHKEEYQQRDSDYLDANKTIPILGYVSSLAEIIKATNPKEVLISVEKPNHTLLLRILSICTKYKIIVKIVPDLYDMFTGQVRTLPIYGIPLIEISSKLLTPLQGVIKRTMDIVISLIILILGFPLWLLIAIIIKLESKGPIFYKQPRIGKDGQQFMIYKFRSMVEDADKEGQRWTSINDPRVTKFGKFIRKTHLDEIPQFINVLKGEMSIVGPRPEQPLFVEKYAKLIPYYRRRLLVRPGITGWWQVHYKSHVESKEEILSRLKDDFYYIENISLRLDIEIMIRTIYCIITGHGQT